MFALFAALTIGPASADAERNTSLLQLIDRYEELAPEVVAARFEALTAAQLELLGQWEMLGASIATRICHSESVPVQRILWESPSGEWTCAELLQNEREAHQWGAQAILEEAIEGQRTQALAALQPQPST
ncbi:MAG: hypothetical protein AAFV53_25120 [Myxococcota bacterium]